MTPPSKSSALHLEGTPALGGSLPVSPDLGRRLLAALSDKVPVTPQLASRLSALSANATGAESRDALVVEIVQTVRLFAVGEPIAALSAVEAAIGFELELAPREQRVPLVAEASVVSARAATHRLALLLGFGPVWCTKAATAASELARNVVRYAGRGTLLLVPRLAAPEALELEASDHGPGIGDVEAVLQGTYRSASGLGLGLRGVRAIAQAFRLESAPGAGTRVWARFAPPSRRFPAVPTKRGPFP